MVKTHSASGTDAALLRVLQALADEKRLRILEVLRQGERCVCELQASLDVGQSLLSHHLRALRDAGVVQARREGRWVHYSLSVDALEAAEAYLRALGEDAAGPGLGGSACPL